MTILITGGNFYNKGAELMLVTLVSTLREYSPEATLCVSPFLGNPTKLKDMNVKVLSYPLYHYGDKSLFEKALKFPFVFKSLLLLKGKKIKGDISFKEVNIVMDISGFAFGEKWGTKPLHNLKIFSAKMKRHGIKFFLMPQAFGPFTKGNMKGDINAVVQNCNLVITRDEQSFEFVNAEVKAESNKKKVLLFPDITLTFKKPVSIEDAIFKNPFCAIVPNERMLDKASARWQSEYFEVLQKLMTTILAKSTLNIIMLIHAQGQSADADVGKKAIKNLPQIYADRIFYYVEEDPVRLKSIIAKSAFLIGSRFHALASALSSNIPAIGTSWLHKYEMLFKDYNVADYSFNEPDEQIYIKAESLLNEANRNSIRLHLEQVNTSIKNKSQIMWDFILKKLR